MKREVGRETDERRLLLTATFLYLPFAVFAANVEQRRLCLCVMMMCIRRACRGTKSHYFGSPADAVKKTLRRNVVCI